jgi:geranylgeranyl diphosphate synthase type I
VTGHVVDLLGSQPYGAAARAEAIVSDTTRTDEAIREFATYAGQVRPTLEASLAAYFEDVRSANRHLPEDVQATIDTVRDLTLRGGKRLRAVLLAAGFDAAGGKGGPDTVVMGGVALELLQSYLLIHDDWMDQDEVRRGGPSVPAMLRKHFCAKGNPGRTADAFAILAGDFAGGLALEALQKVPVSPACLAAASHEMARIERDVVLGQMCDLSAELSKDSATFASVELTHRLKTGSYTVRGPLCLGASLAGADAATKRALEAFAEPLGVAFQLRDDVLGTFGDPRSTGKPSTGDLRQGKRTGLIAALAGDRSEATAALLERAFGRAEASDRDLEALAHRIAESGAKKRVEDRIDALLAEALRVLGDAPFSGKARTLLAGAAYTLGHREK